MSWDMSGTRRVDLKRRIGMYGFNCQGIRKIGWIEGCSPIVRGKGRERRGRFE
jgi:hypothetical protein